MYKGQTEDTLYTNLRSLKKDTRGLITHAVEESLKAGKTVNIECDLASKDKSTDSKRVLKALAVKVTACGTIISGPMEGNTKSVMILAPKVKAGKAIK